MGMNKDLQERKRILADLIRLRGDVYELGKALSNFPWDCELPLVMLLASDLASAVARADQGQISRDDLEYWANLIEGRDDVDYENEGVREELHRLANPYLNNGER